VRRPSRKVPVVDASHSFNGCRDASRRKQCECALVSEMSWYISSRHDYSVAGMALKRRVGLKGSRKPQVAHVSWRSVLPKTAQQSNAHILSLHQAQSPGRSRRHVGALSIFLHLSLASCASHVVTPTRHLKRDFVSK
jgi:hypothetical protein